MLSKIKRIFRKNKTLIKIILLLIVILIISIVAYKLLFYSSDEKSIYGVRLSDINQNKINDKELKELEEKTIQITGINKVDINIQGRLIKYFINVDSGISKDDIKNKMNEMVSCLSENTKGYYDITLYAKQVVVIENDKEEEKNVVIGYKHKNKTTITFTEL